MTIGRTPVCGCEKLQRAGGIPTPLPTKGTAGQHHLFPISVLFLLPAC